MNITIQVSQYQYARGKLCGMKNGLLRVYIGAGKFAYGKLVT